MKKEFFQEPSYAKIREGKTRVIKPGKLVSIIEKLWHNQYYLIGGTVEILK